MTDREQVSSSRHAFDAAFASAAMVVGTLSLVVCFGWLFWMARTGNSALGIRAFVASWAAVALLGLLAGWLRLHRAQPVPAAEKKRLGEAVLPPIAAAAGASFLFFWNGAAYGMCVVWITCYGLSLLNTREALPPAIVKIGWLFLGTGIGLMTLVYYAFKTLSGYDRSDAQTLMIMALTFGGFHLLHALGYAMRRKPGSADVPSAH